MSKYKTKMEIKSESKPFQECIVYGYDQDGNAITEEIKFDGLKLVITKNVMWPPIMIVSTPEGNNNFKELYDASIEKLTS